MNFKEELQRLGKFGNNLLTAIENKSWDDALRYSHEWSMCIEGLFNSLNTEQLVHYRSELTDLNIQHHFITEKLTHLHAKTLTQLQGIKNHRAVKEYYNCID